MDRQSVNILRHIKKSKDPVSYEELISTFGNDAGTSISFLLEGRFIKEGREHAGVARDQSTGKVKIVSQGNGRYKIDAAGKDFLQHRIGDNWDKWITRLAAFIGLISGVISLILHFVS